MMCVNKGTPISVTYVICVLQMLEASRNASCFTDTIEYVIFAHTSGISLKRVFQSIMEVLQIRLNTRFAINNRIRVLQSIIESCFAGNNRLLIT